MTVARNTVTLTVGATALHVISGTATLDEGWSPYAQANLTVTCPDTATQALLDPRGNPSVVLTLSRQTVSDGAWSDQSSRTFTLLVRSTSVQSQTGNLVLTLASGEAALQDARLVATAPDKSLLPHQSSVRAIVTAVLARHSWVLQAGTADADFTTTTRVENLAPDPSGEAAVTGWVGAGNTDDVSNSGEEALTGVQCVRVASLDAGVFDVAPFAITSSVQASPGDTFTFAVSAASETTNRKVHTSLRWLDSSGNQVGDDAAGADVSEPASGWARPTVTGTVPAGAASVWCYVQWANSAAGEVHFVDDAMLTRDNGLDTNGSPYGFFDGDTADNAYYAYSWADAANASTSVRTPLVNRTPDALTQQPGTSEWDVLSPVLQQSGLRLFCDETGMWRVVDNTYSVAGVVRAQSGFNVYDADTTIDRDATQADGTPLWADGAVFKYSWTDDSGNTQQAWDAYQETGATKIAYLEKQTAYPGPGQAEYYVKRMQGRGLSQSLTAAVDFGASPGMVVSSTIDGIDDQTGYASSVAWDLSADTMTVGTRALIDAPAGSWVKIPDTVQWGQIGSGTAWTSWGPPTWE